MSCSSPMRQPTFLQSPPPCSLGSVPPVLQQADSHVAASSAGSAAHCGSQLRLAVGAGKCSPDAVAATQMPFSCAAGSTSCPAPTSGFSAASLHHPPSPGRKPCTTPVTKGASLYRGSSTQAGSWGAHTMHKAVSLPQSCGSSSSASFQDSPDRLQASWDSTCPGGDTSVWPRWVRALRTVARGVGAGMGAVFNTLRQGGKPLFSSYGCKSQGGWASEAGGAAQCKKGGRGGLMGAAWDWAAGLWDRAMETVQRGGLGTWAVLVIDCWSVAASLACELLVAGTGQRALLCLARAAHGVLAECCSAQGGGMQMPEDQIIPSPSPCRSGGGEVSRPSTPHPTPPTTAVPLKAAAAPQGATGQGGTAQAPTSPAKSQPPQGSAVQHSQHSAAAESAQARHGPQSQEVSCLLITD